MGYESFFVVLTQIPLDFLTDGFVKDRETIFPILKRPDYKSLKPSGLADFMSKMSFVENVLLKDSPYIGGDKLSLADIHVIWGIRWGLNDLGVKGNPGVGKDDFPKVWKLIDSLPEAKPENLSSEDTIKTIKGSEYFAKAEGIQKDDPLGFKAGTKVTVESLE